jgi:hypothetical protein
MVYKLVEAETLRKPTVFENARACPAEVPATETSDRRSLARGGVHDRSFVGTLAI